MDSQTLLSSKNLQTLNMERHGPRCRDGLCCPTPSSSSISPRGGSPGDVPMLADPPQLNRVGAPVLDALGQPGGFVPCCAGLRGGGLGRHAAANTQQQHTPWRRLPQGQPPNSGPPTAVLSGTTFRFRRYDGISKILFITIPARLREGMVGFDLSPPG